MQLAQVLRDQGLTSNETAIFLATLRLGQATVAQIAARAATKRPTAYVLLDRLRKMGLVGQVKRGKVLYYRAISPYALLDDRYRKYNQLKAAVPELARLHELHVATPEMTIYEGANAIQQVMENTLTSSTEILAWANMELATNVFGDYYRDYVRRRVENKIRVKAIFAAGPAAAEYKRRDKEELRESYVVPAEELPLYNEINIYDHKLAIISHSDQVGVIIQNKAIADTQRAIFMMTFKYAKLRV